MRSGVVRAGLCGTLMLGMLAASPWSWAGEAAGEITAALTQWTEDFNAGRADKICNLFAKDARAEVAARRSGTTR